MKPPYDITPKILQLLTSISEKIGVVNANFLVKQTPQLRKQHRIKTIHSSLKIEGNTLTEDQITAIIEEKHVVGPKKDIQEVVNAIKVYDDLNNYDYQSEASFLQAHADLMLGLIDTPGKYRKQAVGIVKGGNVHHLAPPHENVPFLMKDLFDYLNDSEELPLLKSCVFHYELEFIHPFLDGNGRMGRLWQTMILKETYPIFEFLPFESLIQKTQSLYYKALEDSDNTGKSTVFIEYMLDVIDQSLGAILNYNQRILKDIDRLDYFLSLGIKEFTRKDYLNLFKDLSTATASRDLKKGVALQLFTAEGTMNKTKYVVKNNVSSAINNLYSTSRKG